MRGYNDSQVETQKTVYGASGNSDREASTERPLSEWSDDELFRALPEWDREWVTYEGTELRKRDWLPWHGSDKAPVGPIEIYLSTGDTHVLESGPMAEAWRRMHTVADIIAYRPVPAKAKHADDKLVEAMRTVSAFNQPTHDLYKTGDPDAPEVIKDRNGEVILGLCRICGKAEVELDEPCERSEPAADAGEVEWLANHIDLAARGEVTPAKLSVWMQDNGPRIVELLKVAALRPAPSEEQVERAARTAHAAWWGEDDAMPFGHLSPVSQDGWRRVARAILASQATKPEDK